MSDLFSHQRLFRGGYQPKGGARPAPPTTASGVQRPANFVDQICAICGKAGHFGFDVCLRKGRAGRWSCLAHCDQVRAMK